MVRPTASGREAYGWGDVPATGYVEQPRRQARMGL
jgi:hypothetical protein